MCNFAQDFAKPNEDFTKGSINLNQDFTQVNPDLLMPESKYTQGLGSTNLDQNYLKDLPIENPIRMISRAYHDAVVGAPDLAWGSGGGGSSGGGSGVTDKTNESARASSSSRKQYGTKGNLSAGGKTRAGFSQRKRSKVKGKSSQINKLMIN